MLIENRRYIGCKAKLVDWIIDVIERETENVDSFCDIFAGTAVVSDKIIGSNNYKKVIINDFLYSNNIIYKAFFGVGECDRNKLISKIEEYNLVDSVLLEDNYFSNNFGGKYFYLPVAKKIGYIRQNIEDIKVELTEKEYCVLIASLIYSIDRLANTLGHYEAYIKKEIKPVDLYLELIDYKECDNVLIYREDSNLLVRNIDADVFYVDPPYNSRQYSRFYHLYETLVKWDMPQLHGVAMKPKAENMSEYCSSRAVDAFSDLIFNIKSRYIVVSYNNTYNPKSSSSKNKIALEEIKLILEKKGETQVFEHEHQFFNAGKTEFDNHKEILFVTKVNEK